MLFHTTSATRSNEYLHLALGVTMAIFGNSSSANRLDSRLTSA
jgi:hypothetical protein